MEARAQRINLQPAGRPLHMPPQELAWSPGCRRRGRRALLQDEATKWMGGRCPRKAARERREVGSTAPCGPLQNFACPTFGKLGRVHLDKYKEKTRSKEVEATHAKMALPMEASD
ncbi:hypothetical protein NDU88_005918 [Pleurodeles waltl]|uniref:Uncharacterized protein n=1 Tax=Pleurodeles waltl TaxID=8319 RepID=A0AAV7L3X0_PLEWA|nr:hypothetical protein NDU88_005918 [Pleurodeles waltl]